MKKLKLNAEAIEVQSFEAAREPAQRGTVQAHESDYHNDCTLGCPTDGECTYWRSCWTERYDCTPNCTEGGWTCYPVGC
jgi:hypothetical protein